MSDESSKNGDTLGVLGDGSLLAGKSNMALAARALRENWPLDPKIRQLVVGQMSLIVGRSDSERNKIAAAKVLVAADSVNARRERDESGVNVNVTANVTIEQHRTRILGIAARLGAGDVPQIAASGDAESGGDGVGGTPSANGSGNGKPL